MESAMTKFGGPLQRPAPEGSLTIEVAGVQWWWRVRYRNVSDDDDGLASVELANEIVLPIDQPIQFVLTSEDVIHSFWIPALGGKMDMIPGRETRLTLLPLREGVYRGVCAEYCGAAHAQMAIPQSPSVNYVLPQTPVAPPSPAATELTPEELTNIRVYEIANRGVVNINTKFESFERFFGMMVATPGRRRSQTYTELAPNCALAR